MNNIFKSVLNKLTNTQKTDKFKSAAVNVKEKKKIDFIFEQHPELQELGSWEEYSEYIKTIFPQSSFSSIFFHGGRKNIESFRKPNDGDFKRNQGIGSGTKDYGIYFTGDKALAKQYTRGLPRKDRQVYPVMLDIKNPLRTNAWLAVNIRKALKFEILNPQSITTDDYNKYISSKGHDSIIWQGKRGEVIVFEPEQIHILGSKKDIEQFKKWKAERQMSKNMMLVHDTGAEY